jgi:prepilin-type N-terminal cleavage/methylation domain-containing protein
MLKSRLTRLREARISEVEEGGAAEAGFTLIELMVVLLIIAILLAIAIPTFLGVANSASDRAAQSNLTNALTEAKALYQNSASYAGLTTATFTASAPEFSWVTGAGVNGGCTGNNNCISMQVIDATSQADGQGMVLAAYSNKSQACWYAVDLEATAASFVDGGGNVPFITAGVAPTGATTAGVFYAKKTGPTSATNCNANWAATRAAFGWGPSYSNAGAAA